MDRAIPKTPVTLRTAPVTPNAPQKRRYRPLLFPASPRVGNIELNFPDPDTDHASILRRCRSELQKVLCKDVDFILTECLGEELITGPEYIYLKGRINCTPEKQARELINTILIDGKEEEFLKLLISSELQEKYEDLRDIMPEEVVPLHVSLGVQKARELRACETEDGPNHFEQSILGEPAKKKERTSSEEEERVKDKVETLLNTITERVLEKDFLQVMIENNKEDEDLVTVLNFFIQNDMQAAAVKIMKSLHGVKKTEHREKRHDEEILSPSEGVMPSSEESQKVFPSCCEYDGPMSTSPADSRCVCGCSDDGGDLEIGWMLSEWIYSFSMYATYLLNMLSHVWLNTHCMTQYIWINTLCIPQKV